VGTKITRKDITVSYLTSASEAWERVVININPQLFVSCEPAVIDKALMSNIENKLMGARVIEVDYTYNAEQARIDLGITKD